MCYVFGCSKTPDEKEYLRADKHNGGDSNHDIISHIMIVIEFEHYSCANYIPYNIDHARHNRCRSLSVHQGPSQVLDLKNVEEVGKFQVNVALCDSNQN